MPDTENLGSFFKENKKHLKDYLETRVDIFRLKMIRIFSKSAGYFIWIIVSLFLLWLFIIFMGLVTGFWLSSVTGSYTKGFGITALIILLLIILLALLRRVLFVNPIIRAVIKNANEETETGGE